jgi:hypothetical protein
MSWPSVGRCESRPVWKDNVREESTKDRMKERILLLSNLDV